MNTIIKPGTVWSRLVKDQYLVESFEFNHLEDGHCPNDVPTPKHPDHNQTWKGKWRKEFVTLINDGQMGVDRIYHYNYTEE